MKTTTFEIKVALLGHVSAGKSTVLNALLQGKFSEVAMRRTTAGINFFRVYTREASGKVGGDSVQELSQDAIKVEGVPDSVWRPNTENTQTADQTLETIKENNQTLRVTNTIQESSFYVSLDEPLCEMRPDTDLVLIDVPGLNEAGSKDMYRDYVNTNWSSFDCVVAVMDVNQGVNTEEQVELIRLIHRNCREKKDVPVIVLCNKVDDLDDDEILVLVEEVRAKVEEIFQMIPTIGTGSSGVECGTQVYFLPISAGNAFVYRIASRLSFDDFKKLDKTLIEKLGRDEVGRSKWRKLTQDEKYQEAFAIISCKTTYEGSLQATNFHLFLDALNRFVGGSTTQTALLQKQLDESLQTLTSDGDIAHQLMTIRNKNICLGMPPLQYEACFWKLYVERRIASIRKFRQNFQDRSLQEVMSQLVNYHVFIRQSGGDKAELDKIIQAMASIVRMQINLLAENARYLDGWTKKGSLVDVPLYDWDKTMKCWRLDSANCCECNDSPGFDTSGCQKDVHLILKDCSNNSGTRNRVPSLNSNKKLTNAAALGEQDTDKKKPPDDSPHHWRRLPHGWHNIYTGEVVKSVHHPVMGELSWESLSPLDYSTMCSSILLLSYSKSFCEYFGREKSRLEGVVSEYHILTQRLSSKYDSFFDSSVPNARGRAANYLLNTLTQGTFDDQGEFVPKYPDKFNLVAQVKMASELSDPNHWGNLAWQFCQFMEREQKA